MLTSLLFDFSNGPGQRTPKGDNSDKKKYESAIFFMRNQYTLALKNKQTNAHMDTKAETYMLPTFFKFGGIKTGRVAMA